MSMQELGPHYTMRPGEGVTRTWQGATLQARDAADVSPAQLQHHLACKECRGNQPHTEALHQRRLRDSIRRY
jgi:hypothetical protein